MPRAGCAQDHPWHPRPGRGVAGMALITLSEAKTYLRVDTSEDDALIGGLLLAAERLSPHNSTCDTTVEV